MSGYLPTLVRMGRAGMLKGVTAHSVQLLFFDGCPHWRLAEERLEEALRLVGLDDVNVEHVLISTAKDAEQRRFPTILVNGEDPFAEEGAAVGLSCRLFRTSDGPAGAPTVDQLTEVLGG